MGMVKICSPSGWSFDEPIARIIKIAADGLRGNDRKELIKRAGATTSIFLPVLDSIKIAKDQEYVHTLAVGAHEAWGSNRNGDSFYEDECKKAHDTFVKFGRCYRNHKNRPHEGHPHYGEIKLAAYNPEMRRIELLLGYNKTKSAADRTGGLIADKELEKLAGGGDLAGSMACRVPYDVCSHCGNKARTRDEYCTREKCAAGGCKDNLATVVKVAGDLHHLHVRNIQPGFFDWSSVFRPAERTAYGSSADYLTKAAEDLGFFGIGAAKLAEDLSVMAPLAVVLYQEQMLPGQWTNHLEAQVKLAHGLVAMGKQAQYRLNRDALRAFTAQAQPGTLDDPDGNEPGTVKFAAWLGALADRKIVMPLREFARLTKRAALGDVASARVAGALHRMLDDGSLERGLMHNAYAPAEKLASGKQRGAAMLKSAAFALDQASVIKRCQLSTIRQQPLPAVNCAIEGVKLAAADDVAEQLARDYTCYKVAALRRIASFDDDFLLTARLAAAQDQTA